MHTNNDHFVSLHIYSILVILFPFWVLVTIFFSILFQSCLRSYNQNSIKLENLSNWMITQGICLLHCAQFQYTTINVFCLKLSIRFFLLESKQIMDAIVCLLGLVWFIVFNATFNNISAISVEETGVPRENHWPVTNHWQTLAIVCISTWITLYSLHFIHRYVFG